MDKDRVICTWKNLTQEQQQIAIRQYITIREIEEERQWDDILSNKDYDSPIDWKYVKTCLFEIDSENNLFVLI